MGSLDLPIEVFSPEIRYQKREVTVTKGDHSGCGNGSLGTVGITCLASVY